jgi:hypothetical protein
VVDHPNKIAFKYRVIQEFDVVIYYEAGVEGDTDEEVLKSIEEDVIDLAYNDEGLVARIAEEAENGNAFLALVTTHEPVAKMLYNVETLPKEIAAELKKRKIDD